MRQAMSETVLEQISAFLDGEAPEREVDLLLRRLERSPELRMAMARYCAIGAALRDEPPLSVNFTRRVRRAIDLEIAGRRLPAAKSASVHGAWMRKVGSLAGGLALAATVAGVAILLLQRGGSPEAPSAQPSGIQLIAEAPASRGPETVVLGSARGGEMYSYTVPAPVKTSPIVPAARLTDYVFAHSEYSSPLGRRNVLSAVIAEDPTPVEPADEKKRHPSGEAR